MRKAVLFLSSLFMVGLAAPLTLAQDIPIPITCTDNAQFIEGNVGTTATITCPAGCLNNTGSVWGTDIYTDDSAVCTAAIHAGVLTNDGGTLTLTILDGQKSYPASERNGISTSGWGQWGRSFSVTAANSAAPSEPERGERAPGIAGLFDVLTLGIFSEDRPAEAPESGAGAETVPPAASAVIEITADLSQTLTLASGATIQLPANWIGAAAPNGGTALAPDGSLSIVILDGAALDAITQTRTGGVLAVLESYYSRQGADQPFDAANVEMAVTRDGRAIAALPYTLAGSMNAYAMVIETGDGLTVIVDARAVMADITEENKQLALQIASTLTE